MTGNPLISWERRYTAHSSTFSGVASSSSCLALIRGRMGAKSEQLLPHRVRREMRAIAPRETCPPAASRELGHHLGHQTLHLLNLVEDRVEQDQLCARLCHLAQTSHAGVGWPVGGQEPPIQRRSTTAVRRPAHAMCHARSLPPAPLPRTRMPRPPRRLRVHPVLVTFRLPLPRRSHVALGCVRGGQSHALPS